MRTTSNHSFLLIAWRYFLLRLRDVYNLIMTRRQPTYPNHSDLKFFNEVQARAKKRTDFNEHLPNLFVEALNSNPRLIVELGTRGGDSTFVLERAARLCKAKFISVDIVDCSGISNYPDWIFVKADDISFGHDFPAWCRSMDIASEVDLLFIDTSHKYEHTIQEIQSWFGHLSAKAKVIFHDTNLKLFYFREDGSMDIGWNNQRGVIRALENYFGIVFDETRNFVDIQKNWLIRHWAHCSGFTVLEKIPRFFTDKK